jgi:opacity protein-like surface antigen
LDARLRPFADVALGGAYAGGSLSPANSGIGGSADAFAFQAGGGLQLRLSSRWMLQPVQAEYLMTTFSNNGSNRQNDLRLGTGLMVRFGH